MQEKARKTLWIRSKDQFKRLCLYCCCSKLKRCEHKHLQCSIDQMSEHTALGVCAVASTLLVMVITCTTPSVCLLSLAHLAEMPRWIVIEMLTQRSNKTERWSNNMYTHWRNTTGPLLISISALVFVISFHETRFGCTERSSQRGEGDGIFVCLRTRSLALVGVLNYTCMHRAFGYGAAKKFQDFSALASTQHTNSSHNFHFDLISAPSDRNRIATYLYRRMKMIATMQRCNYFCFARPVWRLCVYAHGRMSKVETCNREIFPEKKPVFVGAFFCFSFHRLFDENEYF